MQATQPKPQRKICYAIHQTDNAGQLLRVFFEEVETESTKDSKPVPILFYSTKFGQISECDYFDYIQKRTALLIAKQGSKTALGFISVEIIKILSNLSNILNKVIYYNDYLSKYKYDRMFATCVGIKSVNNGCDPARVQQDKPSFFVNWVDVLGSHYAWFPLRFECETFYQKLQNEIQR